MSEFGLRFEAIVALLRSRDEGLPENSPRSAPSRGFSHRVEVVVDCPDCLERRSDGLATFGCETCGGAGVVRSFRERDPYAAEADDKVAPYGLRPDGHEARRRQEAELARLEVQVRPPFASPEDEFADANAHPFGWEVERAKRYRAFDYAALDRALDGFWRDRTRYERGLREVDEQAYHVLHSVYVYGYAAHSSALAAVVLRGLVFLEARMPDPIRAPGFDDDKGGARRKTERRLAS